MDEDRIVTGNDYETVTRGYLYLLAGLKSGTVLLCYNGSVIRLQQKTDYDELIFGKYRYWFAVDEGLWFDLAGCEPGTLFNRSKFESVGAGMWLWLNERNDYEAKRIFEAYFRNRIDEIRDKISDIRTAKVKCE